MPAAEGLDMVSDVVDAADKSRQKSCNACVRSKRRCDKRTPRCTRCAEKNFSCVYQNMPPASSAAPAAGSGTGAEACMPTANSNPGLATSSSSPSSLPASFAATGQNEPLEAMDLGDDDDCMPSFNFNTLDAHHPQHQHEQQQQQQPGSSSYIDGGLRTLVVTEDMRDSGNNSTPLSSTPSLNLGIDATNASFDFNSVMDFINADPVTGGEIQLWETPLTPVVQKTITPELNRTNASIWEEEMPGMCVKGGAFRPWEIHEPSSRVGHLVGAVKNMHVTFAQTKQTPFLHRHLYRGTRETPRPLLAAYTAISAYVGRTEANKDWAIRALCEGTNEVLKGSLGTASHLTGHEKLARTQALWLLQTIRCFDGDIYLRAQAEQDMAVLEAWVKELEVMRDNFDEVHFLDEGAVRGRAPRSWEVWLFNECVRRMVFMGHMFISLFEMLKASNDQGPDTTRWLLPHRWTFSRHLWEAESSPAFYSAWREKPMFLVNSFFLQQVAKMARPADVDDFARLFLTM
ncbi:uncharacterized protein LY79DRAFT_527117 [Colletotrichum navitas]|uniref:Zn(2)-C6 fungal-type domain-containing protein n=1 Tax=Colletotrichum navitas TaxID=681940 RepID=A0AAD8PM54_9PEZI|nr:uncharacterized protein LY79DRAFT_527117 [Colletotrichum navitas]KAK1570275.1 hypothetical protein LY79DRAFT_527117 [Colletotrichum navitas]